ncbi:MAG TPA: type 2 lanthipeptide synthetase LanM [Pirellulales bacterium]|nr:type 2 lanthipeptide synthetase LanM [Pirellulales bacterium]
MTTHTMRQEAEISPTRPSVEDPERSGMLHDWLVELSRATADERGLGENIPVDQVEALGFLNWLEPLVCKARRRFREAIGAAVAGRADILSSVEAFEAAWLPVLARRLSALVVRTCALELNVARLQDQLSGDTPQERFTSFLRRLRRPKVALALAEEYHVLTGKIAVCLDQWHEAGVELAERLASDAQPIQAHFFPAGAPGRLEQIEGNVGDQHRDGRSVLIFHFASGARLVYKPRPLAVDAAFAHLVECLNARGVQPALRPLRVLDRGQYGWTEFIPVEHCTTPQEVYRFYNRQGMYLALFTTLAAADLHYENLIAHGEHPVFVDLEALFYRRLPESTREPARKALLDSALGMRLLPQTQYYDGVDAGIDFSGLGAAAGKPLSYTVVDWNAAGTDVMELGTKSRTFPAGKHRPRLPEGEVSLTDFQPALLDGFSTMHALLQRECRALIEPGGPIAAFAGCEVRFIPRPTQAYAILNTQSLHPDHLRDEAEQVRIHDRLRAKTETFPSLLRLMAAERADLARGDIPLFTSRPDSLDVWTSRGERIKGFFAQRSIDIVLDRLRQMDADDLARQLWLIQASFASVAEGPAPLMDRFRLGECEALEAQADALLAEQIGGGDGDRHSPPAEEWAERLAVLLAHANRLRQLAWQNEREAGWISLVAQPGGWELAAVGLNRGSGLASIASFLLKMERLSGVQSLGDLGRKAMNNLRRQLAEELRA